MLRNLQKSQELIYSRSIRKFHTHRWYTAPTIINTFIEEYGFSGKKVIMFATSGSSTPDKALKDFRTQYPDINWVEAKLLNGATSESLALWVKETEGK